MANMQLTVASAKPSHLLQEACPDYSSPPRLSSLCTQQAKPTQERTTLESDNLGSIPAVPRTRWMTGDSHFPALSLSFSLCKMKTIEPTSKDCWEDKI